MSQYKKKVIFDVGAFDGADGIMLALKNKNYLVYAFEANPYQYNIIKSNKRILEKRIGKKINNYNRIFIYNIEKRNRFKNEKINK